MSLIGITIPNIIVRNERLNSTDKLIYGIIFSSADEYTALSHVTNSHIHRIASLSLDTISKSIILLNELNLIFVLYANAESKKGRRAIQINIDQLSKVNAGKVEKARKDVVHKDAAASAARKKFLGMYLSRYQQKYGTHPTLTLAHFSCAKRISKTLEGEHQYRIVLDNYFSYDSKVKHNLYTLERYIDCYTKEKPIDMHKLSFEEINAMQQAAIKKERGEKEIQSLGENNESETFTATVSGDLPF